MQIIFAGICIVGAMVGMIFVKSLDLNGGLTIAILIPLVFLVIYSLARIKPQKTEAGKDTGK